MDISHARAKLQYRRITANDSRTRDREMCLPHAFVDQMCRTKGRLVLIGHRTKANGVSRRLPGPEATGCAHSGLRTPPGGAYQQTTGLNLGAKKSVLYAQIKPNRQKPSPLTTLLYTSEVPWIIFSGNHPS